MHDLCGFRQKRFVCQVWHHLLILSFSGSKTLRVNRTQVSHAIYGMYVLLSLGTCTCTLGTIAKSLTLIIAAALLTHQAFNGGFFSTLCLRLRVCMFSCHAMCILVVATL